MEKQLRNIEEKIQILLRDQQLLMDMIGLVEKKIELSEELFQSMKIDEMQQQFNRYFQGEKMSLETMMGKLNPKFEDDFK